MFQQRVAIRMNFLNHVNIMEHAFWFPVSKPGLENWISEKTGIQTHICLSPKPGLYTCSIPAFPGKELAGTGQGWAPGNWVHGQRQHGKKMSGKWGCSEPDLAQESIWRVQQGWKEALATAAGWQGVEGVVQGREALKAGSGNVCTETQHIPPNQICTQDTESLAAHLIFFF